MSNSDSKKHEQAFHSLFTPDKRMELKTEKK